MLVFQQWDGMRVLDDFTITKIARIERAFGEVEGMVSSEDYKKFKDWIKRKKVNLISSALEEVRAPLRDFFQSALN